jgi:acetate---CoA ligase (ADP-forming)
LSLSKRNLYTSADLAPLITPKSVAVIGASPNGGFGQTFLLGVKLSDFSGKLYAVNPNHAEVAGVPCFPSVRELPESVDCAAIAVRAELVVSVLEECAERGVRSALINTSGFAETGSLEGISRHQTLVDIANRTGIRICGPNSLGLWNFTRNFSLGASNQVRQAGSIGVVAQSGGLGIYLTQARTGELGRSMFSYCLCAGNSADVDSLDLGNYLLEDPSTTVVVLIVEGIKSHHRLTQLGQRSLELGKPVLVFKSGRTGPGARAAMSHSGSIAGSYAAHVAAFERAGVVVVHAYEDLVETAGYFAKAKPSRRGGVGVVAAMGGTVVIAADGAADAGIRLPPLAARTREALAEIVPEYGVIGNPTDITARPGSAERLATAVRAVGNDPAIDTIVVPLAPRGVPEDDRPAKICAVGREVDATLCVYWMSPWLEGPGAELIAGDPAIPIFHTIDRLYSALQKWAWWNEVRERQHLGGTARQLPAEGAESVPGVSAILDEFDRDLEQVSGVALNEMESRRICALAGLAFPAAHPASSADEAVQAATSLGYPVAVKVLSRDIAHKSAADGVRIAVADSSAVAAAFTEVTKAAATHVPGAHIEGALIAKTTSGGREVFVGASRDPQFGPVISLGWSGATVENGGASVNCLGPLSQADALAMIDRLPGAEALQQNGRANSDAWLVADALVAVSRLMETDSRIAEIDISPLAVLPGAGATALDCLVVLRSTPA